MELASFVDGLAAAEMFEKTVAFLDGDGTAEPIVGLQALLRNWSKDGFFLRRGMNIPSYD